MRKGIVIATALAAGLLVAGCTPKFDGPIKGKQVSDNKVQIKFKICVRDLGTNECAPPPTRAAERRGEQLYHLLAFRVPKGTNVRDAFATRDGEVTYESNGAYGRELKRLAPTPNGTKWFGFVSEPIGEDDPGRARYKLRFGLPSDPGNVFEHRPVTGWGVEDRQIDCGDSLFSPSEENANTTCVSDPTKRKRIKKSKKIELD